MDDNKGIHDGHRDRVRARFINTGLENFCDHQILELLLFYGIPRKDTNEIAHKLLDRYGSFSSVLDAPLGSLQECGLSYNCAVMLKLIPSVCARYYNDKYKQDSINQNNSQELDFVEMIKPYFIGKTEEQLFAVLVDAKGKVLFKGTVSRGVSFSSEVSVQKLVRLCVQHRAKGVAVAHDHSNGIPMPTDKEIELIKTLRYSLRTIGVILLEYYIIADLQSVPLSEDERYAGLFF